MKTYSKKSRKNKMKKKQFVELNCRNLVELNEDIFVCVLNFLDFKAKHNVLITNKKLTKTHLYQCALDYLNQKLDKLIKDVKEEENFGLANVNDTMGNLANILPRFVKYVKKLTFDIYENVRYFVSKLKKIQKFVEKVCEFLELLIDKIRVVPDTESNIIILQAIISDFKDLGAKCEEGIANIRQHLIAAKKQKLKNVILFSSFYKFQAAKQLLILLLFLINFSVILMKLY
jgi:hypothetical protein